MFDAQNPLGETILERRKKVQVEGGTRWMASAEDIVLLKAFSDRARDHEDLMKLVAVGGSKLDLPYIEQWCESSTVASAAR